jgi:hypothetical protein
VRKQGAPIGTVGGLARGEDHLVIRVVAVPAGYQFIDCLAALIFKLKNPSRIVPHGDSGLKRFVYGWLSRVLKNFQMFSEKLLNVFPKTSKCFFAHM